MLHWPYKRRRDYYGRDGYLNELGTWAVGMLFLLAIFLVVYLCPGPVHSEPLEGADIQGAAGDDITAMTTTGLIRAQQWWLRKVNAHDSRHARVGRVAGLIVVEAAYYELDPYVLLQTLIDESSLRLKQIGKTNNEVGLGQQHGQALTDSMDAMEARGIDPSSLHGQIGRTAWVLWEGQRRCKNALGMVARYLSGSCKPSIRAQRRAQGRLKRARHLAMIATAQEMP